MTTSTAVRRTSQRVRLHGAGVCGSSLGIVTRSSRRFRCAFSSRTLCRQRHALAADEANGEIWISGELDRQRLQLRPARNGEAFHLFVCPHNDGALSFVKWLSSYLKSNHLDGGSELTYTEDIKELGDAEFFLLYLNKGTWQDAKHQVLIEQQVKQAFSLGVKLCIVHEMREACDGALEFDEIYRRADGARIDW